VQSIEYLVAALAVFTTFLIATSSLTGIIVSGLNYSSQQNLQSQAQSVFENMLTSTGSPNNWGVTFSNPTSFGLAETSASNYNLDANKLLRLSTTYPFALSYTYVQNSLGLSQGNYKFKITFLQPFTAKVTTQGNVATNSIATNILVQDTRGYPVPLATVAINMLMYLNFTTNLANNHGNYVSQSTHYGWIAFQVQDANSNVTYNVASIQATGTTNEIGIATFNMDLGAIFGQTNMVSNVPVIIITGKVTLGNIQVPFGSWWAANGINLHVFSNTGISGWTLKDSTQSPPKYYLVVYGPVNSTLFETELQGSNLDIEVVVSTPNQAAVDIIFQAQSWTSQNGQAYEIPLLASGAPIQSLLTFNTQGSGQDVTFHDILVFMDPLLLLGPSGSSQPLNFGAGSITPTAGPSAVELQRFVLVEGFSYIVDFWFWR
jgi:hypothetical protein